MHYVPATIPRDLSATVPGVLHRAADLVATASHTDDVIAQALDATGVTGDVREALHTAAERACDAIARSRCHSIAQRLDAASAGALIPWHAWQCALVDPWPVLADAAARTGFGDPGISGQIRPGRWEATAPTTVTTSAGGPA